MDLTKEWVFKRLPQRPDNANKGTFGKVLVIAGSENYPGAAYLACAACYRVGTGLVTLATEPSAKIIVSRKLPEVTFLSYDETFGKVGECDAVLIGPGLGQNDQAVKFMERMPGIDLPPAIIDGDGLGILSKMGKWWERFWTSSPRLSFGEAGQNNKTIKMILTPHPGEMALLTGLTVKKIQANRINVVQYFAKKWDKVVVLKGANTVVASPAGEVALSPFANPILATAGTGDVLAGVIAGMLAQGLEPFDASRVGVFIHGAAGEMVSKKLGDAGMLASDLLPILPKIIKQLKK